MTTAGGVRHRQRGAARMGRRAVHAAGLGALAGLMGAMAVAHAGAPEVVARAAVHAPAPVDQGVQIARSGGLEDLGEWTAADHPSRLVAASAAAPLPASQSAVTQTPPLAPAQPARAPQRFAPPAAAPVHAPALPAAAPAQPQAAPAGVVSQVIADVNSDRAAAGLPALRISAALDRAAAVHAGQNASADQMSHDGVTQDVAAQGVSWSSLGECLGWVGGSPDAGYINRMWMQSPEHRPIILGNFTTVGAGWAQSASGKWYVSLIVIS